MTPNQQACDHDWRGQHCAGVIYAVCLKCGARHPVPVDVSGVDVITGHGYIREAATDTDDHLVIRRIAES